MHKIVVLAQRPYHIYIGSGVYFTQEFIDTCKVAGNRFVIVTEHTLYNLDACLVERNMEKADLRVHVIAVQGGEENKTREMKTYIEDQLLSLGCGRDTVLIAIGGGVILDLVGFVAATYCRGIPAIYLPTTLLAMVDASIGGKTGVNTQHGKNLIGTFTPPHAVFIDIDTLKTLPTREFKNGMAEVVKHAAVFDAKAFAALENNQATSLADMIVHSCEIKQKIVEQDEHESGLRQLLNFGHTVGHAIELATDHQLKHGEAIALGMWIESAMAVKLNYMSPQAFERIQDILSQYELISDHLIEIDPDKVLVAMQLDKKVRHDKVHMVMLQDIGEPFVIEGRYSHIVNLHEMKDLLCCLNDEIKAPC